MKRRASSKRGSLNGLTALFAGRFVRSATQAALGIAVPLYMLALGYGPATVGAVVAVGALSSALLQLAVGWLADRVGRKPVLAAFGVLTTLGSGAYALHLPLGWLMVATALGTIGQGGGAAGGGAFGPYYPAEQPLIAELAGDARRTSTFARLSLIGAIGGILGSLAAAWPELLQRHGAPAIGSYAPLFWVTAGFGVVLALVVVPIREERPAHPKRFRAHLTLTRPTRAIVARFMLTNATNGLAIGYLGPIVLLATTVSRAVRGGKRADRGALYDREPGDAAALSGRHAHRAVLRRGGAHGSRDARRLLRRAGDRSLRSALLAGGRSLRTARRA